MKRMAIVLLVVAAALPARADLAVNQPAKDEWGTPEIALRVKVRSQVSVVFVLYASGRVLYRSLGGGPGTYDYLLVTLSPDEKHALVEGLPIDRIGEHVDLGLVSSCKDCATYCVDGWSVGSHKRQCTYSYPEARVSPAAFAIWDRLRRFASPRAKRWVPPQVTVTVQLLSPSFVDSTTEWPRRWPTSGTPIRLFGREGWTFTLDGGELPDLHRVLGGPGGWRHLQLVDGRRVATSFDYALPHEEAWKRE